MNRNYAPTSSLKILSEPPSDFSAYFGTIKVVPSDNSYPTKKERTKAIESLLETAKECGANYIYIRNYDPRTSDFIHLKFLDQACSDGLVIEAELFR